MTTYINQTRVGDNVWAVNAGEGISFGTAGNQITIDSSLGLLGTGGLSISTSGDVMTLAGNRVLIATATAGTTASVSFTGVIDNSAYNNYYIRIKNAIPMTEDVSLMMVPSSNNGGTDWSGAGTLLSTISYLYTNYSNSYADNGWYITPPINTGEINNTRSGYTGNIYLFTKSNSHIYSRPSYTCQGGYDVNTNFPIMTNAFGILNPQADITSIKFEMTSGDIRFGVFELYGEK